MAKWETVVFSGLIMLWSPLSSICLEQSRNSVWLECGEPCRTLLYLVGLMFLWGFWTVSVASRWSRGSWRVNVALLFGRCRACGVRLTITGWPLSGKMEMSGISERVREMSENWPNVGEVSGVNLVVESCLFQISFLLLYQCLVALFLHVHYCVKYDVHNRNFGGSSQRVGGVLENFSVPGDWSPCGELDRWIRIAFLSSSVVSTHGSALRRFRRFPRGKTLRTKFLPYANEQVDLVHA